MKSWRSVSNYRQPYRCMAQCVVYGFGIGVGLLLIGIPLLIFFGGNLKETDTMKKIPAWIGLITAGTGFMAIIMGVTLLALLCRLINQRDAATSNRVNENGGVALLQPAIGGPSPYPTDTVYAPTVYNIDTAGPMPLYKREEKIDEKGNPTV